ncbi:MAG: Mrp/NBP35 family ATP-binding protein [Anaerolineales bacterium]
MLSENEVLSVLSKVNDPELHRSLTDLKMVRNVTLHNNAVEVTIALTVPDCPFKDQIEADVYAALLDLPEVKEVAVNMTTMTDQERKAVLGEPKEGSAAQYNRIQRVIAVMSGKGGVGKSLVTSILAVALAQSGYHVGLLDADITGPSIPKLFGLHGPLEAGPLGVFPLSSEAGVKVMSINLLMLEEDKPVVWRGPLIGKAITQLWGDVMWGNLDYLLVDLPPGTSDASLTTLQSIPVSGIIMVTTPQSLASLIVRKAVHMAQLVGTPIIGVVENMAYFKCPDTGKQHQIFGPSHANEVVRAAVAPLLAQLPINPLVTSLCDAGKVEAITLPEITDLLNAFLKAVPLPEAVKKSSI